MQNHPKKWTKQEEKMLIDWYAAHTDYLNLKKLATKLGRTEAFLCRKARELGLTKLGRKPKWMLDELSERMKKYDETEMGKANREKALQKMQAQNKICHPKGMLGKTHTEEYKRQMSERVKKEWQDPDSTFNSEQFRQKRSDIMSKQMIEKYKSNSENHSRGHGGRRSDLNGLYLRSSWEANYARYLNFLIKHKNIYKWEYEPDTFYFENIKRGTRSYTPDFKIWKTEKSEPYYVEVKGWMDQKSKTKLSRMKKYYPNIRIVLISEPEYNEIKNKLSALIPNWE